jgi:hypothetical protein
MARHTFTFQGGEELTTMGASWFVSYCYYKKIKPTHLNWRKPSTSTNRISVFGRTQNMHKFYLERVLEMDITNLNKNRIDLSGIQIKEMAKELLEKW